MPRPRMYFSVVIAVKRIDLFEIYFKNSSLRSEIKLCFYNFIVQLCPVRDRHLTNRITPLYFSRLFCYTAKRVG